MMQGGKQEDTGSCRIADHDDCSFRGHLGDNNRATALFGSTFHRWLHSIHAALPDELSSARSMAKYSPLAAAIIAPTSTLLDIPALSVRHRLRWPDHSNTGIPCTARLSPTPRHVWSSQLLDLD